MDPGVRSHVMKADPPRYLWSKYKCFLMSGWWDILHLNCFNVKLWSNSTNGKNYERTNEHTNGRTERKKLYTPRHNCWGYNKWITIIIRTKCNVILKKQNKWATPWENLPNGICEQQRRRSACASVQSDQRLCCSLPRYYNTYTYYSHNFKTPASLCSWADRLMYNLVGNPDDSCFFYDVAQF